MITSSSRQKIKLESLKPAGTVGTRGMAEPSFAALVPIPRSGDNRGFARILVELNRRFQSLIETQLAVLRSTKPGVDPQLGDRSTLALDGLSVVTESDF